MSARVPGEFRAPGEAPPTPVSEVAMVTVGVADLEATTRFYAQVFQYRTLGEGEIPAAVATAWRMPAGLRGRYRVLSRAGERYGRLRLLAFDAPGTQVWGRYERIQDHGLYALNLRVGDVQATWRALLEAGARPKSGPTRWNIDPTMVAIDSQCWDLDGTLLDVYTMEGRDEIFTPLGGRASAIETLALHVANADRSWRFYEALGYSLFFDKRIGDLGAFFHLPAGVVLRDVNLIKPERSATGRVEIVQLEGLPGEPVRGRAHPPHHGVLSMSFEVGELDVALAHVCRFGAEPCGGVHVADLQPDGARRRASVFGPDGELVEFVEAPEAFTAV